MPTIRPFGTGDADVVAGIIVRCLREVNSRDYPPDIIDRMCAHFTPGTVEELAGTRQMFVAVVDGEVVGTISRDGNRVYTMFVRPDAAGRGIGRLLLRHVEALAAADGHDVMETGASITGHGFYQRLGYHDVYRVDTDFGLNYILRRALR
ncbi:GNAT family N-acetyltransferase [Dactylosporangium aurantiacum]|uniref:GNAT family N-acetyltransferase n=1 Tax=Dactylosporangium aurantiacum TaxID=35754 RepID=A0A9Q9INK9_9ACTN|nr:GNAT family N-acetyltransferase [Dactylosporangium aurantiacum]MDG6103828.1 GNAT family N-acetyltransferase [Dactylosporangium aurantiacum]UWZ58971.1 GNAT family N-acetyltransferase [Dactylosporangium aurantiacum]